MNELQCSQWLYLTVTPVVPRPTTRFLVAVICVYVTVTAKRAGGARPIIQIGFYLGVTISWASAHFSNFWLFHNVVLLFPSANSQKEILVEWLQANKELTCLQSAGSIWSIKRTFLWLAFVPEALERNASLSATDSVVWKQILPRDAAWPAVMESLFLLTAYNKNNYPSRIQSLYRRANDPAPATRIFRLKFADLWQTGFIDQWPMIFKIDYAPLTGFETQVRFNSTRWIKYCSFCIPVLPCNHHLPSKTRDVMWTQWRIQKRMKGGARIPNRRHYYRFPIGKAILVAFSACDFTICEI